MRTGPRAGWREGLRSYSPFALDGAPGWAAAVTANGGTYTAGQQTALAAFIQTLRTANIWPGKIDCFGPLMGNELAAALVQFKNGVWGPATNTLFVGGDYTPSTGLTGNGTSKSLDTGLSILSLNKADFGMGTWTRTNPVEAVNRCDIGSSYSATGVTDRFYNFTRNGATNSEFGMGDRNTSVAATTGLVAQETTGTTTQNIFANGVNVSSLATWNNQGPQAGTVTVFNGAGSFFSNHALNGYYVGKNLDQAALNAAWTTLNTALGR